MLAKNPYCEVYKAAFGPRRDVLPRNPAPPGNRLEALKAKHRRQQTRQDPGRLEQKRRSEFPGRSTLPHRDRAKVSPVTAEQGLSLQEFLKKGLRQQVDKKQRQNRQPQSASVLN